MNKLLGKINKKGRGVLYKKFISNLIVYEIPDFTQGIKYTPTYKLENNEWFYLENFSRTPYCLELLTKEISSVEYDTVEGNDLLNVSYLCSIQDDKYYCLQGIKKSQKIYKKKWISFKGEIKNENLILINDLPDAIYIKDNDRLYFKALSKINNIFNGINELYREATEDEVNDFLRSDYIKVDEVFDKSKIGILDRKNLALAMDEYNKYNAEEKEAVLEEIKENFPEKIDNFGKFEINNMEDFKIILSGLLENTYITRTGKRKISNSSRVI